MAVIPVELAGRSYEVRVGAGLLADLPAQCGALLRKEHVPIVIDANVARHWREPVEAALLAAGREPRWLVLDPGEARRAGRASPRPASGCSRRKSSEAIASSRSAAG